MAPFRRPKTLVFALLLSISIGAADTCTTIEAAPAKFDLRASMPRTNLTLGDYFEINLDLANVGGTAATAIAHEAIVSAATVRHRSSAASPWVRVDPVELIVSHCLPPDLESIQEFVIRPGEVRRFSFTSVLTGNSVSGFVREDGEPRTLPIGTPAPGAALEIIRASEHPCESLRYFLGAPGDYEIHLFARIYTLDGSAKARMVSNGVRFAIH